MHLLARYEIQKKVLRIPVGTPTVSRTLLELSRLQGIGKRGKEGGYGAVGLEPQLGRKRMETSGTTHVSPMLVQAGRPGMQCLKVLSECKVGQKTCRVVPVS